MYRNLIEKIIIILGRKIDLNMLTLNDKIFSGYC